MSLGRFLRRFLSDSLSVLSKLARKAASMTGRFLSGCNERGSFFTFFKSTSNCAASSSLMSANSDVDILLYILLYSLKYYYLYNLRSISVDGHLVACSSCGWGAISEPPLATTNFDACLCNAVTGCTRRSVVGI